MTSADRRTDTERNIQRYSEVQCIAVQFSAVKCITVQSTVQFSAVQCSAVHYSAKQCSAVKGSTVHCSAVQCSAVHIKFHVSKKKNGTMTVLKGTPGVIRCSFKSGAFHV